MLQCHEWYWVYSLTKKSLFEPFPNQDHSTPNKDTFGIEIQETGHLSRYYCGVILGK